MAKFKINDSVIVIANGQRGTVVCREEETDEKAKRTKVTYLVKLGNGFENYRVFSRNELKKRFVDTLKKEHLRNTCYLWHLPEVA